MSADFARYVLAIAFLFGTGILLGFRVHGSPAIRWWRRRPSAATDPDLEGTSAA